MPPSKICVILNEKSGAHADGDQRRARLEQLLEEAGLDAQIHCLTPDLSILDSARKAARDSGCAMLVAAGGDGTIGAVASVCHEAGLPMGVIPQGTFNYFARGLDIPEDMEGAVQVLATGVLRDLPLGEVNGKIFLNNASLGIYPMILRTREGVYQRWGRSRVAAYWSVILALAGYRRPLMMRARIDGQEQLLRTPLAFVANSAYQLDQFNLDGAEEIRKGRFVLLTSKGARRGDLVRAAARLATGTAQRGEDFNIVAAQEIVLETRRRRVLVARDGEKEVMTSPITFRLRDTPLRVAVPAGDTAA